MTNKTIPHNLKQQIELIPIDNNQEIYETESKTSNLKFTGLIW